MRCLGRGWPRPGWVGGRRGRLGLRCAWRAGGGAAGRSRSARTPIRSRRLWSAHGPACWPGLGHWRRGRGPRWRGPRFHTAAATASCPQRDVLAAPQPLQLGDGERPGPVGGLAAALDQHRGIGGEPSLGAPPGDRRAQGRELAVPRRRRRRRVAQAGPGCGPGRVQLIDPGGGAEPVDERGQRGWCRPGGCWVGGRAGRGTPRSQPAGSAGPAWAPSGSAVPLVVLLPSGARGSKCGHLEGATTPAGSRSWGAPARRRHGSKWSIRCHE